MSSIRPSAEALQRAYKPSGALRINDLSAHASRRHHSHFRPLNADISPLRVPRWARTRAVAAVAALGLGAACWSTMQLREVHAEAPPRPVDMVVEEPKRMREGMSKEDNRGQISSQHLQVKRSWENPGVYAWGSNVGRVAAPDAEEAVVKTPRRIRWFDGVLLKDLKLSQKFGAAISENGDLLQWGTDYFPECNEPSPTLKGKNLVSLAISSDRIIALSSTGRVYSVPVSREDQDSGPKPLENTLIPFWRSRSPISYREIHPSLPWSERVIAIASGLSHALLLTSSGRVFSAASSSASFPTKGELGIPGLTWESRPPGDYDQPHEISTLRGFQIRAIAAGDNHSLALDSQGRVFSFGDNSSGQLGFEPSAEVTWVDAPSLIPLTRLYSGTAQTPTVTSISAGGSNSFFTIEATRVARPGDDPSSNSARSQIGRISADTWASGGGILGSLGTGRWTHIQGTPSKIKPLSGLFEFEERNSSITPIRLARLSIGATHAAATMDNVTYLGAHAGSSQNDTNWGADVMWWGGNEHWQLGTGRRNNVSTPMYIGPLDGGDAEGKRDQHRFHATPKKRVKIGSRWVELEQRVECGRYVTAVYSGV